MRLDYYIGEYYLKKTLVCKKFLWYLNGKIIK